MPTARAALLDAECADDAALRREVESLLAADQAAADEPTVPALAASPDLVHALLTDHADDDEQRWLGIRIGAFEIERVLGRGGMGAVFLANRVDGEYAQQVAIKLIRQGYGSGSLHARLRAERQILASLAHPRIARLLDGGVAADGTPYIVMEYVDGANLLEYCHAQQLSLQARLELFLSLLDAVEYAHQRLVVHRDIKPSNILVDQDGRAKLLDFGVAKLLAAEASTTAAAGAAPFTPAYAAPEQIRGETVTTAIDIYALGLVLYEVLTGARPYRVDESSPRAYEIAVLEQTPTRPSDAVRADRDIDVARVRKALRGDLDAIVLKALRKEPAQRYASVADFAADIRCHLTQRPVAARQGNFPLCGGSLPAPARLRARARRHRAGRASLAGPLLTELQRREAVAARERAESEAARANQVTEFMVEVFEQANPEETDGAAVSAIALLESARARIDTQTMDAAARATMLIGIARAIVGVQPERITSTLTEEAVRLLRPGNNPLALAQALTAQAQSLVNEKRDPEALPLLDRVGCTARRRRAGSRAGASAQSALARVRQHEHGPQSRSDHAVRTRFRASRTRSRHARPLHGRHAQPARLCIAAGEATQGVPRGLSEVDVRSSRDAALAARGACRIADRPCLYLRPLRRIRALGSGAAGSRQALPRFAQEPAGGDAQGARQPRPHPDGAWSL